MESQPKKSVLNRVLVGIVGLTLSAVLVGCSNDPEPAPDLEETNDGAQDEPTEYVPASSDGPAQNVPTPTKSGVTAEESEDGAEATLLYFWESAEYLRLTGDSGPLQGASSSECEFCQSFIDEWDAAYSNGKWAAQSGEIDYETEDVWSVHDESDGVLSVDILFSMVEPAVELYSSQSQVEQKSEADEESSTWYAYLTYDGTAQQWQVEWVGLEELVTWNE